MASPQEIREALVSFLADNDLLEHGEIVAPDSMAMMLISMEIENRWAPFPPELLEVEHFISIDSIVRLIEELIRRTPPQA